MIETSQNIGNAIRFDNLHATGYFRWVTVQRGCRDN